MNKNVFFLCDFVKTEFVSFQFNQNINTDPFISFYTRISVVDVLEMKLGSERMRNVSGVKMEKGWVSLRWFSQ